MVLDALVVANCSPCAMGHEPHAVGSARTWGPAPSLPSGAHGSCPATDSQPPVVFRRASRPFRDGCVADVTEILDAQLRRKEAGRGEITERVEPRYTERHLGPAAARVGHIIERQPALRIGAVDKVLVESLVARMVKPRQPATVRRSEARLEVE